MRPMHWKRRLKYLNAVADHLIECGYQVEQPKPWAMQWFRSKRVKRSKD